MICTVLGPCPAAQAVDDDVWSSPHMDHLIGQKVRVTEIHSYFVVAEMMDQQGDWAFNYGSLSIQPKPVLTVLTHVPV